MRRTKDDGQLTRPPRLKLRDAGRGSRPSSAVACYGGWNGGQANDK